MRRGLIKGARNPFQRPRWIDEGQGARDMRGVLALAEKRHELDKAALRSAETYARGLSMGAERTTQLPLIAGGLASLPQLRADELCLPTLFPRSSCERLRDALSGAFLKRSRIR